MLKNGSRRLVLLTLFLGCVQFAAAQTADAIIEKDLAALGLNVNRVGIKATTNEALGFIGREEGIAAMAVASVELPEPREM